MVPEKPSGILRVESGLYEDLGKPVTAQEWHTALLLPDEYEIKQIEQLGDVYELRVLSHDIPNDEGMLKTLIMPSVTASMVDKDHRFVAVTSMCIQQWDGKLWHTSQVDIPVQTQKQKIIEVALPDISTK